MCYYAMMLVSDTLYGKHTVLLGIQRTLQSLLLHASLLVATCNTLCPDEMEIKNVLPSKQQWTAHGQPTTPSASSTVTDNSSKSARRQLAPLTISLLASRGSSRAKSFLMLHFHHRAFITSLNSRGSWSRTVFPGRPFIKYIFLRQII